MAKKTKSKQPVTLEYLNKHAQFLQVVIPYYEDENENLITFSNGEMTELECDEEFVNPMLDNENRQLKLLIDLQDLKVLNWNGGYLRMSGKVRDSGYYTLMDAKKKAIKQIKGYIPNRLLPPYEKGCGDYIDFTIKPDGSLMEWRTPLDFTEFMERGREPEPIPTHKWYRVQRIMWDIACQNLTDDELVWLKKSFNKLF